MSSGTGQVVVPFVGDLDERVEQTEGGAAEAERCRVVTDSSKIRCTL